MASKKDKQFVTDAKKMDDATLTGELKSIRSKLFTLRTQATTEKVEDLSQFRKNRRNVARVLTEMNARLHKAAAK